MNAIVILSHLMDPIGKLCKESIGRADLAIDKLKTMPNIRLILTIGWAYRQDSDKPIGLSVKEYLVSKGITQDIIKTDINSRDTVGDAIFSKINFLDIYKIEKLYVVTSDYHVMRTKIIFESIIPINIEFLGFKTSNNALYFASELDSLRAFKHTFKDANLKSNESLIETLRTNHPYYNGEIYEKIDRNPIPLIKS